MSASADSTDTSLIVRVQARESAAWQALVDLYAPWIYGWARRYGLAPEDGADVTQDTFLAAHRSIGQFRRSASGDSFRGWLWTIARNKIRDVQRRQRQEAGVTARVQQIAMESPPESLPDEVDGSQLSALLHRGLAQVQAEFEPRTWEAFWQVVVEGRLPVDVAASLGMSAVSVRQAKSRILRRLRLQLGEWPPGRSLGS